MRKKLVALSMAVLMLAVAVVGGTLAYFTDTESETNTFTVGNVDIKLLEVFDKNAAKLVPGSKTTNAINKDVWVENTGSNNAWVRVKVYIPAELDQLTTPDYAEEGYEYAASFNTVHWNTVAGNEKIWNVNKANVEAKGVNLGNDGHYNEYIFYYNQILAPNETTAQLLDQVYLDSKVDCEITTDATTNAQTYSWTCGGKTVNYPLENGVNIIVKAEAIQADGFDSYEAAFAAFDKQVG